MELDKKIDLDDSGFLASIFVFQKKKELQSLEGKRYKIDPSKEEDTFKAYDLKYGNFDYSINERSIISEKFKETFVDFIIDVAKDGNDFIITGVNNGYEVGIIKEINNNIKITGVDLSKTAIGKLIQNYDVDGFVGDMQYLPFENGRFDTYISLRSIHSSCVDLKQAIKEAKRVTKKGGKIILSVSNGYLKNGEIIKGMYDYKSGSIDQKKPYEIVKEISDYLMNPIIKEIDSEIFIVANNV